MPSSFGAAGNGYNYPTAPGYQNPGGVPSATLGANGYYINNAALPLRDLQFKPSPFYTITSRIGDIRTCEGKKTPISSLSGLILTMCTVTTTRNSVQLSIRASEHASLTKLASDRSYRIMVFSSADNQTVQDIAFPIQCEIKVNGGEIKANLRGLKGKPGTTRPVDITDALRLKPSNYNNNVEFTYAQSSKVNYPHPLTVTKISLVPTWHRVFIMPLD